MAKTAFVTGNRGFIGRHITRELLKRGYRVLGVDANAVDNAQSCFRRLEDRFDLVVHCAYVVGGRATIDGRNTALIENTMLDSMLFDWALRTRQKAVIYFSSSAAYPISNQTSLMAPYKCVESDIDFKDHEMPDSNYGWAKLTGERLGRVAADNGLRVHTLRPFSGCSYDQSFDYPWPSIARRAKNFDFQVWGVEGQRRDWVDISDVLGATLAVYEADVREPVNVCTGIGTEMGDLMKMFARKLHGLEPEVKYLVDKPMGVYHRVGDPSFMSQFYTPKKNLEQMIDETVSKMQDR